MYGFQQKKKKTVKFYWQYDIYKDTLREDRWKGVFLFRAEG